MDASKIGENFTKLPFFVYIIIIVIFFFFSAFAFAKIYLPKMSRGLVIFLVLAAQQIDS